jgi:RNA polymerase sigma-70 factor (ECF subfamily)
MIPYKHFTDTELAKMLQEAEAISSLAFEELYNRYWKKLLTVAFHRLGSLDEAKEVVQEVFYNLWKHRSSLQLSASPSTYLATAVKYEVINRLAKLQHGNVYQEHIIHSATHSDNSTLEWLAGEDLRLAIAETVKALPEKCRVVYELSREHDYSQNQIAHELNISVKTVEAHISRALKSLRTSLKQFQSFLF